MKKYRVVYWSNLYKTEWIIGAPDREAARKRFKQLMGEDVVIIQISEVNGGYHN